LKVFFNNTKILFCWQALESLIFKAEEIKNRKIEKEINKKISGFYRQNLIHFL